VGSSPGQALQAFSRRRASARRGWLALPVPRFPSAGTDAEQLPPLALTCSRSPPLRRPSGSAHYPRPPADRSRPVVSGSSPGVPLDRPSTDIAVCVHALGLPFGVSRGSGLPHPNTFRPRRSSRPRRLPPHTASRVCCTPQPVLGFARFPAERAALRRPPRHSSERPFPLRSSSPIPAGGLSPGSLPPRRRSMEPKSHFARPRGLVPVSRPGARRVAATAPLSSLGVPSTQAFTGASALWGSVPFGDPALSSSRRSGRDTLPAAPRPQLPADAVATVTRRLLEARAFLPHSGRCARRGHLPTHTLAGADRGARDGDRTLHHGPGRAEARPHSHRLAPTEVAASQLAPTGPAEAAPAESGVSSAPEGAALSVARLPEGGRTSRGPSPSGLFRALRPSFEDRGRAWSRSSVPAGGKSRGLARSKITRT
jgi:hypothetical protein